VTATDHSEVAPAGRVPAWNGSVERLIVQWQGVLHFVQLAAVGGFSV